MVDNLTEAEQVEALKKWWKENGMAIIIGLAVGLSAVVGVRYWFSYQEQRAADASFIYSQFAEAHGAGDAVRATASFEQLKTAYDGTPYAALAAMQMARQQIEQNKLNEAEQSLRWAVGHPGHESLELVAKAQLARVLSAMDKFEQALQLVQKEADPVFAATYAEIRGDIYRRQGDPVRAREAYQLALADTNLPGRLREYIEMKLQDLPADNAGKDQN